MIALIAQALTFAEETATNVIWDHQDIMTDSDRGQILRALSDHVIAVEVIASTLRKETVLP